MTGSRLQYTLAGAFAQDKTPDGGYQLGGTVFYSGVQAARLGAAVTLLSVAHPSIDLGALDDGIRVHLQAAPRSTIFENIYDAAGNRTQTVSAQADALDPAQAPALTPDILHLGPLLGEIGLGWLDVYAGARVAITPQGWLRQVKADGRVLRTRWAEAEQILPRAWACVFSEEDLNGDEDAIGHLAALCPVSVCTRHVAAASLFVGRDRFEVPTTPARPIDPTGAGDVFAAAFFIRYYETDDPLEAVRFAHIAAAQAIKGPGVSRVINRATLDQRMQDAR